MGEIYYERILLALMLPMNSTTPWNSVETLEKIGQNIIWRNMIKNLSFEKKIKNIITLLVNATMSMMKLSKVFIFCLANDCTSLSRHSKYLWCVSQWGELLYKWVIFHEMFQCYRVSHKRSPFKTWNIETSIITSNVHQKIVDF